MVKKLVFQIFAWKLFQVVMAEAMSVAMEAAMAAVMAAAMEAGGTAQPLGQFVMSDSYTFHAKTSYYYN